MTGVLPIAIRTIEKTKNIRMKRIIPVILFSFFYSSSFSQGMYGFGIGLGYITSYHSYITPAFEGYHLWRLTEHIYLGGDLDLQRYSFLDNLKPDPNNLYYGEIISMREKSSYLFFSPKIDFSIGYRKYVHINLSGGIGVAMASGQWRNEYSPVLSTASGNIGADTAAVNSSYNVPKVIYRAGLGVSERIPTRQYFNIMLSQEFSYLPANLNRGDGPNLFTNYFSFTVGIMHKYPQTRVEVD